ncbi:MAG: CPBP family intramembrane metalloprotease [Bacteroides sp.]|nr:CPBP family intramembrane metalloprotease [Bacteroides sp.]
MKRSEKMVNRSEIRDSENVSKITLIKPALSNKIGVLICSFFVMIIITGEIGGFIHRFALSERSYLLLVSVLQSVLAFIFPAWLVAFLCSSNPSRYLRLNNPANLRQYIGVLILLFIMGPAMNLIVEWNSNITFPDSLSGVYNIFKSLEDKAAVSTDIILSDSSWWGLISGIAIVGCLTGFAEEIFFRAGLQNSLSTSGINVHVAVWSTAFIFSLLHFQFFGFVPRLILGACFGYIFYFSQSIWLAAFMHAVNNSSVVVMAWLNRNGILHLDIDSFGTSESGQIWIALFSLILTCLFVKLVMPTLFCKKSA